MNNDLGVSQKAPLVTALANLCLLAIWPRIAWCQSAQEDRLHNEQRRFKSGAYGGIAILIISATVIVLSLVAGKDWFAAVLYTSMTLYLGLCAFTFRAHRHLLFAP